MASLVIDYCGNLSLESARVISLDDLEHTRIIIIGEGTRAVVHKGRKFSEATFITKRSLQQRAGRRLERFLESVDEMNKVVDG